jgi:uncharacterized protein
MLRNLTTLFALLLVIASCDSGETELSAGKYAGHISDWDSDRLNNLRSPEGWINLAGLFWLREGVNSIGSGGQNDIIFPRGPENIGSMILTGNTVYFRPAGGISVKADGEEISDRIRVFGENRDAGLITTDSLGFFIIKRGQRTGIRLRDYLHPRLEEIREIERFPPDQEWIIKARFIESGETVTVMVPDVLGEISREVVPGILEFKYKGKTHRLFPTGSGDRLFIIFADETNASETYGGGRFLSAGGPDSDGFVHLDFNKAYNPPCAFSPFATCPLPPAENFLPFRVEAGEKEVPDARILQGE